MIEICYGIYCIDTETYNNLPPIPVQLYEYLKKKMFKFNIKYQQTFLIFTYTKDTINEIHTIAITHPTMDTFKPDIGKKIVIGRIKRMRGEIRKPYDPIPPYIYKLEK